MYLKFLLTYLTIFLLTSSFTALKDQENGTLIISYRIEHYGDRLNRIRILLSTDAKEEMYPKGDAFVEDKERHSRTVAIENLPTGDYKLKFLIPNTDGLFEEIPEKTIHIKKDEVYRIDQHIRLQQSSLKAVAQILPESRINEKKPAIKLCDLNGEIIAESNKGNLLVRDLKSGSYNLIFEAMPGYKTPDSIPVEITGKKTYGPFTGTYQWLGNISDASTEVDIEQNNTQNLETSEIAFRPIYGSLEIQTPLPEGNSIRLIIKSKDGRPPLAVNLQPKEGFINWHSPPLRPGPYEMVYILPPAFKNLPPETFIIHRGEHLKLNPHLSTKATVRVTANIPEAIFILKASNGAQVWKGEGRNYSFTDLPGGSYTLSFATQDPEYFIPPEDHHFYLNDLESKEIKAPFQLAGKLILNTNVDKSIATIKAIKGSKKPIQQNLFERTRVFTLPEGRYIVSLASSSNIANNNLTPPDPLEVHVEAFRIEELNLPFKSSKSSSTEKERKLLVTSNIAMGGFTLRKVFKDTSELLGHFSGKYIQLSLPPAESYEVTFDEIPNYLSPEKMLVEIGDNVSKTIQANYTPIQQTVLVPEGRVIMGEMGSEEQTNVLPSRIVTVSAFAIGTYEVTNALYASWLNKALKEGSAFYVSEADNRGQVIDMDNHLLFKTFEADPYSQISAQLQSTDSPTFIPLPGKDSYPVINVTWYGALAYCNDNKCRLPTEAEWEKAAGMELTSPKEPLKKYRYGFSQDHIDSTWANYKEKTTQLKQFKVLTTPVGFYNGINTLPLDIQSNKAVSTHLAKSPCGAFDMSGNVWEWVSDWYGDSYYEKMAKRDPQGPPEGTQKVVKGGCYDSLADGVRVSERLGLPPDYCDAYTGFRIVTTVE